MIIPTISNAILSEENDALLTEAGDELDEETTTTLCNIHYRVDNRKTQNQMYLPDSLLALADIAGFTGGSGYLIIDFIRESLLAYYGALPVLQQPELLTSITWAAA